MRAAVVRGMVASTRPREDDGASAVEFALIIPFLAMLLMGVVTGALTFSNAIGVTNAVREGARFGATANSSSTTWAQDTIAQVRATQFDDPTSETSVCVQLWKYSAAGSNNGTEVKGECALGGPTLAMPAKDVYPVIPPATTASSCIVRIIAARPYTIDIAVNAFTGNVTRGSVVRYERSSC